MITTVEREDMIEIRSMMRISQRILFLIIALFPLLVPFELVVRFDWQNIFSVRFLFAMALSIGTIVISVFFLWGAIAGLDKMLRFDKSNGWMTYAFVASSIPWWTFRYPLDSVDELEVRETEWRGGASSYSLVVIISDGTVLSSGSSRSKEEIESILDRVVNFLGR